MCGGFGPKIGVNAVGDLSSPVEVRLGDLAAGARIWCSQVAAFASEAQVAASTLTTTVRFLTPHLLKLPPSYDALFQVNFPYNGILIHNCYLFLHGIIILQLGVY